jgi:hypothetical protein
MTVTIDRTILEAIEAAPVPYDLYREVHKGLRHGLFDVVVAVGATDCAAAPGRVEVADRVRGLLVLLHAHHGHEDAFVKPYVATFDPRLSAIIDAGHEETEADMIEIELLVDKLAGADGGDAVAAGLDLYRYLALFTSRYLAHMALEEGAVMSTLRGSMSVAELFTLDMELRAAVDPDKMCRFIAVMAPAMNPDERTAMLGGMQAGAPAELFERFRAAAQAALAPADYAVVAARLGLG